MSNGKNRLISLLLSFVVAAALIPTVALADDDGSIGAPAESGTEESGNPTETETEDAAEPAADPKPAVDPEKAETINWYINLNGKMPDTLETGVSGRPTDDFTTALHDNSSGTKLISTDDAAWDAWLDGTTEITDADGSVKTVNNRDYATTFNGVNAVSGDSTTEVSQVIKGLLAQLVTDPLTDQETLQAVKDYLNKNGKQIATINGEYVDNRMLEQVDADGKPIYYNVIWYVVKLAEGVAGNPNPWHVDGVLTANTEAITDATTVTLQYVLLPGDATPDQALPYDGNVVRYLKPDENIDAVTVTTGTDENTGKTYSTTDFELDGKTYTFQGWFTDPELQTAAPDSFQLLQNTTLYGRWTLVTSGNEGGGPVAPVNPDPDPTPDPDPDPDPTPAPTPVPVPNNDITVLPEEDVPLAELPVEDVPATELPDEDTPLAAVPKTGDDALLYELTALAVGCGFLYLVKKRKDETV
jgi:hypothetical protein